MTVMLPENIGDVAALSEARRGGVRQAAETSQPIISRSKASRARRARGLIFVGRFW